MALIEKFHVVAAERDIAAAQSIKEGQVVSLNTAGKVIICTNSTIPYGIAGDSGNTLTASYMPGVVAGWQNRVSDYFDETKASAKITVYHSGGEFATDQLTNAASLTTVSLQPLYCNDLGMLDPTVATTTYPVARLLSVPGAYVSGVPGTDLNGDTSLGGNNAGDYTGAGVYAEIKLII